MHSINYQLVHSLTFAGGSAFKFRSPTPNVPTISACYLTPTSPWHLCIWIWNLDIPRVGVKDNLKIKPGERTLSVARLTGLIPDSFDAQYWYVKYMAFPENLTKSYYTVVLCGWQALLPSGPVDTNGGRTSNVRTFWDTVNNTDGIIDGWDGIVSQNVGSLDIN
ncbi:hypothetical protein JB92DRAFT_2835041 [Gautieria morchelliformis]|nr:hypothetical protein JB92DRAFT_2835041 [Gautieria morchelliformis]